MSGVVAEDILRLAAMCREYEVVDKGEVSGGILERVVNVVRAGKVDGYGVKDFVGGRIRGRFVCGVELSRYKMAVERALGCSVSDVVLRHSVRVLGYE